MSPVTHSTHEEASDSLTKYLPAIAWRRRWWLIIPLVIGTIAGIVAAFVIPPKYRASATLLVESPEVTALASNGGNGNSSLIDRRIAKVRTQLLSRPDVVSLIEGHGLFVDERQTVPMSKLVDRVRSATSIQAVNANISATNDQSTIAFSLTFDYPEAAKAQAVAQDFVQRLLTLDASDTAKQAANSVQFLQNQSDGLAKQISAIEQQIQQIKAANGLALSSAGSTMISMGGGGYDAQIATLERENAQLNGQLRTLNATAQDPAVVAAEQALAVAKSVYSDNHPDVQNAQLRLEAAKRFASQRAASRQSDTAALRDQIAANSASIAQLRAARSSDEARTSGILAAQSRAPAINEQVSQLQSKAEGLRTDYDAVNTKLLAARGNAQLGSEQKGERLTVVDPPVVPDLPNWPNRPLIAAAGLGAGGILGLALIVALEIFTKPIRGVAAVQRITGMPPLIVVPEIKPPSPGGLFARLRLTRQAG